MTHLPEPSAADERPQARDAVLLDTGFLVALFDRREPRHASAASWLSANRSTLWTTPGVLTEASHFVPARQRAALASLVAGGALTVAAPDVAGHARMARLFDRYADLDPDWADLELVWLAEAQRITRIATLGVSDFGVYRLGGRKAFEIVWPR